jgi:hypothetical protein
VLALRAWQVLLAVLRDAGVVWLQAQAEDMYRLCAAPQVEPAALALSAANRRTLLASRFTARLVVVVVIVIVIDRYMPVSLVLVLSQPALIVRSGFVRSAVVDELHSSASPSEEEEQGEEWPSFDLKDKLAAVYDISCTLRLSSDIYLSNS